MSVEVRPELQGAPRTSLPIRGQLVAGDPNGVPELVKAALAPTSDVTFEYREQVSQEHHELPFILVLYDPLHLLGLPIGNDEVKVDASLTVAKLDRRLGEYRAQGRAKRWYGFFYGATVSRMQERARNAARAAIDEAVQRDADALLRAANEIPSTNGEVNP